MMWVWQGDHRPHDRGHLRAMFHTLGGKSQLVKLAPGQSQLPNLSFLLVGAQNEPLHHITTYLTTKNFAIA